MRRNDIGRPGFEMTVREFIAKNRHPLDKPIPVKPRPVPNKDQAEAVKARIRELLKARQ